MLIVVEWENPGNMSARPTGSRIVAGLVAATAARLKTQDERAGIALKGTVRIANREDTVRHVLAEHPPPEMRTAKHWVPRDKDR